LLVLLPVTIVCFAQITECAAKESSQADRALTYGDLAARLYDLQQLAVPPVHGEKSGAATSYDRASHFDPATDRYINWRANGDGGGSVRSTGKSIVAAELEGPGVVWRIWSADPKDGPIRFYVDGEEQPVLDVSFRSLFDTDRGPFRFKQLVREMAKGRNCFVPIPFNKSLRIEFGEGWGMYYQITYTTFPKGWSVPSFRGTFGDAELDALARADRAWASRGQPVLRPNVRRIEKVIDLARGESVDAVSVDGSGAIAELRLDIDETDPTEQAKMLRELALTMFWDGEQHPSVACPVGDFFGSAPAVHPYQSLPAGMSQGSLRSSWYMPFERGARIKITNDGKSRRYLRVTASVGPLSRPADELLRFHAKWHRDDYGSAGIDRFTSDRYPDWPVLKISNGKGRFCGMHLHVWNPLHKWNDALAAQYEQPTSDMCNDDAWFQSVVVADRYWYGEGEEKFFVDGEKFPSTYGTGTEDYFGFAWGTPALFESATQAQTVNTDNTGHVSLVRYHIADNVPFEESFEASIEKYHGNNWPVQYAVTPFWYQSAGTTDRYSLAAVGERVGYERLPSPRQPRVPEGSRYEADRDMVSINADHTRPQDMTGFGPRWSSNSQLLIEGRIGAEAKLRFAVEKPFDGDIALQLTQAPDYGICDVAIDERPVVRGTDCYAAGAQPAPPLVIEGITLEPGIHTLTFKLTGANAAARFFREDRYLLGIDFLELHDNSAGAARE
jgi:hypothetical protein